MDAAIDPVVRFHVTDVHQITGTGIVLSGVVESGTIRVGDRLFLGGSRTPITVQAIEMFKKDPQGIAVPLPPTSKPYGLIVSGIDRKDQARPGDIVTNRPQAE